MKAAIYHEFCGPIAVDTVPDPSPPEDGVVLRVLANGLCRSDWHGWQGHDADICSMPHVPGHEMCGVVEAVGGQVGRWRPGDRVILPFVSGCGRCRDCLAGQTQVCHRQYQPGFSGWGGFAQFVAVPYADTNLVALPDTIEPVVASALGCRTTTAWRAIVQQGRVRAGEWVAVHGCGGVGLSAIAIAQASGARVIAVDISPAQLALASAAGAEHGLDGSQIADIPQAIADLTDGGAQLSVDALGSRATCRNSILSLRRQGRHVQIGLLAGEGENPPLPMGRVLSWELQILGSHGIAARSFDALLGLLESGALSLDGLIGDHINLAEGARRLQTLGDRAETGITVITEFG